MLDQDQKLAIKKAHSTTSEVRHVSQSMKAFRVIFNHFSARQNIFPVRDFFEQTTGDSVESAAGIEDEGARFKDNPDALQGILTEETYQPIDQEKIIISMDLMSVDLLDIGHLPKLIDVFKCFYATGRNTLI